MDIFYLFFSHFLSFSLYFSLFSLYFSLFLSFLSFSSFFLCFLLSERTSGVSPVILHQFHYAWVSHVRSNRWWTFGCISKVVTKAFLISMFLATFALAPRHERHSQASPKGQELAASARRAPETSSLKYCTIKIWTFCPKLP